METLDRILKSIGLIGSAIALTACFGPGFPSSGYVYVEARRGQARVYAAHEFDAPRRTDPSQPPHVTPARPVTTSNVECNQYSHLDGTCLLLCNEIYYTSDGRRSLSDPFEIACQ